MNAGSTGEILAAVTAVGCVLLAAALAVVGFIARSLINTLGKVRAEQNVQSIGLATLVERVTPMNAEMIDHDTRLRASESGLARLEGAIKEHGETLRTLVGLRLGRHDPG